MDNNPIVYGEKLLYGRPLFASKSYLDIPRLLIIPYGIEGNEEEKITFENFGKTVLLFAFEEGDLVV